VRKAHCEKTKTLKETATLAMAETGPRSFSEKWRSDQGVDQGPAMRDPEESLRRTLLRGRYRVAAPKNRFPRGHFSRWGGREKGSRKGWSHDSNLHDLMVEGLRQWGGFMGSGKTKCTRRSLNEGGMRQIGTGQSSLFLAPQGVRADRRPTPKRVRKKKNRRKEK